MWKNWNPFRRRPEETVNNSVAQYEGSDGKENTGDPNTRGSALQVSGTSNSDVNSQQIISSRDRNSRNYSSRQANGRDDLDDNSLVQQSYDEDDSLHGLSGGSPKGGTKIGVNGHQTSSIQNMSSLRRSATTSPFIKNETVNINRNTSMKSANESLNNSFSGVYGPLLSSPIVPKVRRALESSAGLRSPQTSVMERGRPVGRSASFNYGSGSPTVSTAGQVPWVRLKKRESTALSDLVNGNTPHSPNTVKLAAPEPRFLPSAPSFKTTHLVVTTESNRARVVDTQTVVSALREKRKRFGGNQRNEFLSEDSWINSAKRRRQDSSQSNASSVSIPSMPESLPNLMGMPGMSLLHIENLKDQRPSTMPAMDAFVSRHQREFGLGGVTGEHKQQQPVFSSLKQPVFGNIQQQHHPVQDIRNKQSGKSVLRSIQSSLSSSLRARNNLSVLEQTGVDLNRIYRGQESWDGARKVSASSDVSMFDNSFEEPRTKVSRQETEIINTPTTAPNMTETATPVKPVEKAVGVVSAQTKQKIADGVVLRKHSLSITSNNSPARSKVQPLNSLVSASDFEQDRQKEYKRRVLDLLEEDETGVLSPGTPTTVGLSSASSIPSLGTFSSVPVSTDASSAATSAAVSASLDSLNKLVQSATSASSGSVTVNSLTHLLVSSNGQPQVSSDSLSNKEVSFGNISSLASSQSSGTGAPSMTTVSSTTGGFKLESSLPSASGGGLSMTTSGVGFQINFSAPATSVAPPTSVGIPTSAVVSSETNQQNLGSGFTFTGGLVSGSLPTSGVVGSAAAGSSFSGVGQAVSAPAAGFGTAGVNQIGSTGQQSDNNSLAFKVSSASSMTVPATTDTSQGGMFSSGGPEGTRSGSFSLLSTIQAFAASKSGTESSLTGQPLSSAGGQGFNFTPQISGTPAAATTSSTPAAGLFNFGSSRGVAAAPLSEFSGGSLGGSTIAPLSTATTGLSTGPSQGNSTASNLAFNFGTIGSSATPSAQPLGGLSFGVGSTNAASLSSTCGLATSAGSTGFSAKPGSSVFPGFGANTQTPSSVPTVTSTSSVPFGGGAPAFGSDTIQAQQSFASANQPSTFSLYATTGTATATTSGGGMFSFGQNSSSAPTSKPAIFGAMSNQPGTMLGGSQGTVTTSNSIFGNIGAPSSTGISSIFGGGNLSGFGSSSTVPATSPPAFGNNPVSASFGSSAPTTSPPPFGFTTTSSVFGASNIQTASMFGTASLSRGQPSSAFGTAASAGGQPSSTFGTTTSVGGQLSSAFGIGASAGQPSSSAFGTAPSVGGQPSSTFGTAASTGGQPSSAFGTVASGNQPASVFGTTFSAGGQPSSAFGTSTSSGGQLSSTFGAPASSTNSLFTFGAGSGSQPTTQQTTTFGSNMSTSFSNPSGTPGFSMFGAKSAAPNFNSVPGNPASIFGAPNQSTPTPSTAFGLPLGSTNFGVTPNQDKSAFGTSTAFGPSNLSTFGNASQGSVFGSAPQNQLGLAMQNTSQNAFGPPTQNPTQNAFGSSTQNSTQNAFGSTAQNLTQNAFGPSAQNPTQNAFGPSAQNPTQNAFGLTSPNPQQSGFGSSAQNLQNAFGSTAQNSFGTATKNSFGSVSSNNPPAFGSQQGSLSNSNPFNASTGGSSFGGAKPSIFGASNTSQPGLGFASPQPNAFGSQAPTTGFNFAQSAPQPVPSASSGFNFAAQTPVKPTFQSPAPGGFNFASAAAGSTFNFSGTPSTPNMFTPQTPGTAPRPRAAARRVTRRGGPRR